MSYFLINGRYSDRRSADPPSTARIKTDDPLLDGFVPGLGGCRGNWDAGGGGGGDLCPSAGRGHRGQTERKKSANAEKGTFGVSFRDVASRIVLIRLIRLG